MVFYFAVWQNHKVFPVMLFLVIFFLMNYYHVHVFEKYVLVDFYLDLFIHDGRLVNCFR